MRQAYEAQLLDLKQYCEELEQARDRRERAESELE
jgi:hypothetical protein